MSQSDMPPSELTCSTCGRPFSLRPEIQRRYPGWTPTQCLDCRDGRGSSSTEAVKGRRPRRPPGRDRRRAEAALIRHRDGPVDGVFTDGACSGNPGPGGWAAVHVREDRILDERSGSEPRTTNNRMELTALIEAYRMLDPAASEVIWSDSRLVVQTINEWAEQWRRRGWKRRTGPVMNLDLVRTAYELARAHPRVELRWLKAHAGARWNEYADALATAPLKARP